MQITLNLPDELAQQLMRKIAPNHFAKEAIRLALSKEIAAKSTADKPVSRWTALAETLRDNPISLGEYGEQDRAQGRAFREDFSFKHDTP